MPFNALPLAASLQDRLSAFPFVTELTDTARNELHEVARPIHFPRGSQLLEEGGTCEALLLVERGSIRVFKDTENGKGITLYLVYPGESCLLGTTCMLGDTFYPAQASVDEDTDAIAIPAHTFQKLFHQEDALRKFVIGLFTHRMQHLMLLVQDVAFRKMDERLAGFLLEQGCREPGIIFPIDLSHEQIATHLGTAREVVSRMLHQFAKEQLLELKRRNIIILNAEELRNRTGGQQNLQKGTVL